ncbi:MAG: DUF3817 domain-containing protein [Gordonia sp. (in: high G+C Gram-positive bacteria)]|uniref:DUF3817 domain-containing protein n=1 Tax=Gordonia sp. (in: high G+C Gram-positive bacteria) TaxID=84139 RepID=UPI003BB72B0D
MTPAAQASAAQNTEADATSAVTTPKDKIKAALVRYRVMAWITGVWLLLLVANMIAEYGFDKAGFPLIAIAHGWIYVVYLITTVDLAMKVRWSPGKTVITCLAGTVPFLSFWFEHIRAKDVKATFDV